MQELAPQPFTIQGEPAFTFTALPAIGSVAPDFRLADQHFRDWALADFAGKKKILNIVPSLDTPICQLSAQKFNEAVAKRDDAVVLTISADLPFAQARFCANWKTPNGQFLSTFRSPEFGMNYGTLIVEHALMGLQARAVIVLDEHNVVRHVQLVPELKQEPDYTAALAALESVDA
ncbi:MAG TPA: thiol peroxidase [Kiritimatiellia bacterium]|jgi:thiol peroxidase|nr:thiol peroxidase [Kiritimatiellia bacterium]OQC59079.1 MAG: Thiol peroxidase [Verrucomicrobia bacterium ADurb.Bin018]MBP9571715.1 thiol peroxidase [Kiritimatiellia bacterium]HOD99966.1 thiol peroxidase [Kiritimatiellia bacterium]HOE36294.1 thiol peroxidase [Kiritimatiellia bacterium]